MPVVVRTRASQKHLCPNPQNLEYITLHGKEYFADTVLRWGDYPTLSTWAQCITSIFMRERGREKSQSGRDMTMEAEVRVMPPPPGCQKNEYQIHKHPELRMKQCSEVQPNTNSILQTSIRWVKRLKIIYEMLTPVFSREWGLEFIFPLLCFLVPFKFSVIDDTVFIIERTYFQKNNKNVRRHIAGIVSGALIIQLCKHSVTNKSLDCASGKEAGWLPGSSPPLVEGRGGSNFSSVLCQLCDLGQYSSPIWALPFHRKIFSKY